MVPARPNFLVIKWISDSGFGQIHFWTFSWVSLSFAICDEKCDFSSDFALLWWNHLGKICLYFLAKKSGRFSRRVLVKKIFHESYFSTYNSKSFNGFLLQTIERSKCKIFFGIDRSGLKVTPSMNPGSHNLTDFLKYMFLAWLTHLVYCH